MGPSMRQSIDFIRDRHSGKARMIHLFTHSMSFAFPVAKSITTSPSYVTATIGRAETYLVIYHKGTSLSFSLELDELS